MDDNIGELPGNSNLLQYSQPQLDCKYLSLVNIYSKVYLLHLDAFQGLLCIYKKDKVKHRVNVDPGAYAVRVIDNLIILQNFGLQESTVIDWLSTPMMFKLHHRGSFEINPTLIAVSQEFSLDIEEKVLKRLKLEPLAWVSSMPEVQYAILFLLRRNLCSESALNLLKTAITERKNIDVVLHDLVNGESVPALSQELLYTKVFLPCFKEGQSLDILAKAMLIYVKELVFKEVPLEISLQMVLMKALVKSQGFCILQDLVTYHIISDSKEIAMLLIELAKRERFQYGFMLGIDMLNRMKLQTLVMDVLIANGDMFETMGLLNGHPCPGYDLGKLHKDISDGYTNTIIHEFLRENTY